MKINWFPGHMKKALREIEGQLKNVDVILYVLDSRAPLSSINPSLNKLTKDKAILYIFNKYDLSDKGRVSQLAKDFKTQNSDYVFMNSTSSGASKVIKSKILSLSKEKLDKAKAKGVRAIIRAIVIGVPNSGKSTLVNNLCGKAKAVVGNRPGVTKTTKWLSIGDNIEVCDTPGTLYPNLENQDTAKKLYFIGSIKDEIISDVALLTQDFIDMTKEKYYQNLVSRYGEDLTIEAIAKKRGYLLSKDEYDLERTSSAVLDDFRKGRLGGITLDWWGNMKEYNKIKGSVGEIKAVNYLKSEKYKILETNYRNLIGEIDIIAKKDKFIVFVEVKARETYAFGNPSEAVNRTKQYKIRRTAEGYLKEKHCYDSPCRFDCIEIVGDRINHIEDAF